LAASRASSERSAERFSRVTYRTSPGARRGGGRTTGSSPAPPGLQTPAAVWHLGKLDRGGGSKATDPSYLSFTHRLGCIIVPLAARLILQGYDGGTLTVIH